MKILDFPVVRQSTVDTCSCATVQACLCYYGFNHREGQIRGLMHVDRTTQEIHPRKMVKVIKHFGLKALYRKLTPVDIMSYIDEGKPIILNLQAWYRSRHPNYTEDRNGHYAVAIGYDIDKGRVIFADPASFHRTYLTYEQLEKRWHDGERGTWDYDHMGIVVWGTTPKYSSNKIIRMG